MRRYELQPLLEAMRCTLSQAAPQLNLNGVYYRKYRDEGLPRDTAERLALKAGLHPYEVWSSMLEDDVSSASVECAAEDCSNRFFIPETRGGQNKRFCSDNCRDRVKNRRRRQDERVREQDRARQRAYDKYVRDQRRRREEVQEEGLHRAQVQDLDLRQGREPAPVFQQSRADSAPLKPVGPSHLSSTMSADEREVA